MTSCVLGYHFFSFLSWVVTTYLNHWTTRVVKLKTLPFLYLFDDCFKIFLQSLFLNFEITFVTFITQMKSLLCLPSEYFTQNLMLTRWRILQIPHIFFKQTQMFLLEDFYIHRYFTQLRRFPSRVMQDISFRSMYSFYDISSAFTNSEGI